MFNNNLIYYKVSWNIWNLKFFNFVIGKNVVHVINHMYVIKYNIVFKPNLLYKTFKFNQKTKYFEAVLIKWKKEIE